MEPKRNTAKDRSLSSAIFFGEILSLLLRFFEGQKTALGFLKGSDIYRLLLLETVQARSIRRSLTLLFFELPQLLLQLVLLH